MKKIKDFLRKNLSKTNKLIIIIICIILIVVFVLVAFYNYKTKISSLHQKCPDEYGTDAIGTAEYNADFDKWTKSIYDANPNTTLTDWSLARYNFWVDNKCEKTIERYNEFEVSETDTEKTKVLRILTSEMPTPVQ